MPDVSQIHPGYVLLAALVLWAILYALSMAHDHARYDRLCASERMTYLDTDKGPRCVDEHGDLFLPPFQTKKIR